MTSLASVPQSLNGSADSSPPVRAEAAFAPRINGYLLILPMSVALTLATASECRSITHLPSLMYGAVLWGWWGLLASAGWKLAERFPAALKSFPRHGRDSCVAGVTVWLFAFDSPVEPRLHAHWLGTGRNFTDDVGHLGQLESVRSGAAALRFCPRHHRSASISPARTEGRPAGSGTAAATFRRTSPRAADAA